MRKRLLIVLFFGFFVNAQTKLMFNYDKAGNQLLRELCLTGCSSSAKSIQEIKEIEALLDDDLLKFSSEDVISYYPNPVKEELYIKWELKNYNYVTSIQIFSLIGQVLRSYQLSNNVNSLNVPFQYYPSGVYVVLLTYKDRENKSIKIIKQ